MDKNLTEPAPAPFPYPASREKLDALHSQLEHQSIAQLFATEPRRVEEFTACAAGWQLDYSRHLLNGAARQALLELAANAGLTQATEALFEGEPINTTENRAALHTLLRTSAPPARLKSSWQQIQHCRQRMEDWVERVHGGQHRGFSGERITDVVNLGIGGSDLGPRMVTESLRDFHTAAVQVHFCANIDPTELADILAPLNPANTLFIVCSKSLRTEETLHNAESARRWLLAGGTGDEAVASHFLAVTTNLEAAGRFGIPTDNILPMWDWVGGRYSLWSAVGWSIAFAIGKPGFDQLLSGAEQMDQHFRSAALADNLPVILSLLEIWYVNFFNSASHAVIPYSHRLGSLPAYLQQLSMESNGKRCNQQGQAIGYATAPVLWGEQGTNGQHSFHQLLHQGTSFCPVDFILPLRATEGADQEGQQRLVANCLAQGQALLLGRDEQSCRASLLARGVEQARATKLAPHLVIPGNRPSSTLICEKLSPYSLGALIALYEHKTFCSGHIWQINSFDQWGVELGKELGTAIYAAMAEAKTDAGDASTNALLKRWQHEQ
jgi:glucose-6-phosphate isomerase